MDVPAPLLRGDSRKESTYQKINEILQYLNSSRLCADGQFLRVDKTPSGTILSALRQTPAAPVSGDGYAGYFFVDLVVDSAGIVTVSVVDGSDGTAPVAGCAYYKGAKVDCPKEEGIEIKAGFLCLCILGSGDSTYEISYSIESAVPAAPVAEDGTARYLLAEIIGPDEDGGWYARQIHQGGIPGAAGGSETSEYNGYFKVMNTSSSGIKKIKIVDGLTYNSQTGVSGGSLCRFGKTEFLVADKELTITESGYVYLTSVYDSSAELPRTPVLEFSAIRKTYAAGTGFVPIVRVTVSSSGLAITRDSYGYVQGFIFGDCGDI